MTSKPMTATPATTTLPIDERAAERRARTAAAQALRDRLRLPPKLTLSEWAARYRVLSPESSAEPGPWRNERIPYGVEIMDTISGREYNDITIVAPSQSGKTEIGINNPVGYYIDQEPSPILVIQPNVKPMAEAWSKERLAPMIRDSPRLRGKVKDARSRDSGNTILQKQYPGGFIAIMGANSPAGLASRPIRVVLADELDRWPASAGTEGDPLSLAYARTKTFRHRKKVVKVSSPGNEGESRIEKEWQASDQRHYYVPCPHCGEYQPLEWRDTGGKPDIRPGTGDYRLVWEKEEVSGKVVHHPETAAYVCRACGALIEEKHKAAMAAAGKWVKHNPSSKRAGFAIPGLILPWVRWSEIAEEWLRVKDDPERRKTFFNTVLGLLYVTEGETPDADKLTGRREAWKAEVPRGVGSLTMAIDVQGDRLEVLVVGWGEDEEAWLVRLERLYGDPEEGDVWARAQALLDKAWTHESGATMRIDACGVDAGYLTDAVYRWVRPRQERGVYALRGVDNLKVPMSRASRANRDGVKVFSFSPVIFKDVLFARLKKPSPGKGFIHIGPEETTGIDEAFLHQFGAEKRAVDYVKGVPKVRYVKLAGRRNEAIDLYNMALVALRSRGIQFVRGLGKRARDIEAEGERIRKAREAPPSPPPQRPRRREGGWVTAW